MSENGYADDGEGPEGPDPGLDAVLAAVGAKVPADSEQPPTPRARPRWVGRRLLRLIGVVADRCPTKDLTKFELLAVLVVMNAAVAAIVVPTGMSAAYSGMSDEMKVALGVLGFAIIGSVDALVVGTWVTLTVDKVNPTDDPPPLKGWRHGAWRVHIRRLVLLISRLALTFGMALVLGLFLTLSVNHQVIHKQLVDDGTANETTTINQIISGDETIISTYPQKIATAQQQVTSDQNMSASANLLGECELYGTPRVANCSNNPGPGPGERGEFAQAQAEAKAAATAQTQVDAFTNDLNTAQAEVQVLQHPDQVKDPSAEPQGIQQHLHEIAQAALPPQGLTASVKAFNEYATAHQWSFFQKHLMDILVVSFDSVPVLLKFFSGISTYETEMWMDDHAAALLRRRRRRRDTTRHNATQNLSDAVASSWTATRSQQAQEHLDATGPVLPAQPDPDDEAAAAAAREIEAVQAAAHAAEDQLRAEIQDLEAARDHTGQLLAEEQERLREQGREADARLGQERIAHEQTRQRLEVFIDKVLLGKKYMTRPDIHYRPGGGSGGYVVAVQHVETLEYFAAKVIWMNRAGLPGPAAAGDQQHQRFHREVEKLQQRQHPNIVRIEEVIDDNPSFAAVIMPLYLYDDPVSHDEVADVRELLDKRAETDGIALAEVVRLLGGVASALEACAQEPAIVHRDVKPANVFLDDKGTPILGDFGLARSVKGEVRDVTEPGMGVGTEHYLAPEQVSGRPVTTATDIYGWAATAYELCTGYYPFARERFWTSYTRSIMELIVDASVVPTAPSALYPVIPQRLSDLIMQALAYQPRARPSASELVDELRALTVEEDLAAVIDIRYVQSVTAPPPADTAPRDPQGNGTDPRQPRALPPAGRDDLSDGPPTAPVDPRSRPTLPSDRPGEPWPSHELPTSPWSVHDRPTAPWSIHGNPADDDDGSTTGPITPLD